MTASNAGGSASAKSNTKTPKITYTKNCPPATGHMTGTEIGLLKLNMTSKRPGTCTAATPPAASSTRTSSA